MTFITEALLNLKGVKVGDTIMMTKLVGLVGVPLRIIEENGSVYVKPVAELDKPGSGAYLPIILYESFEKVVDKTD